MTAKRGRPRSEAARQKVLASALEILENKGLARVTIEAVAAAAGVGKPTIYRSWANAHGLSMAALMAQEVEDTTNCTTDSGLEQLRQQLHGVIGRFSARAGKQAALLLATADPESEISKGFRNQVIMKSRAEGRDILNEIFGEGTQPTVPIESLLDMIYGPIFYRLLTRHAPLDPTLADDIVGMIAALIPGRTA